MNNAAPTTSARHLIIGLGITGLSCVRFFQKLNIPIAVADNRETPPSFEKLSQEFPDVPVYLGQFQENILDNISEIIVSPGIPLTEPILVAAKHRGIAISGDIEIFARYVDAPLCAITGSNAKSTVTMLVTEMAKTAGINVRMGGNIGVPALDLLTGVTPQLYVLELSSFQLETTYTLKSTVATILNVTPDHMDRYASFADYKLAKQRIYRNAKTIVYNRDDQNTYPQLPSTSNIQSFGLTPAETDQFGVIEKNENSGKTIYLTQGEKLLINVNDIAIKGRHNWANALAALALGSTLQLPMPAMLETLTTFAGLPHRCQLVISKDGVSWYNDSKGTNVGATVAAIEGLGQAIPGKIILIAGGIGKGADFSDLRPSVTRYVRSVILIGEAAPQLQQTLANDSKILRANSLEDAVRLARAEASDGDAVLLSPACASFDMFKNFEHRGFVFMEIVKEMFK